MCGWTIHRHILPSTSEHIVFKTDPFQPDSFVYLGRTNVDVGPVAAILAYMVLYGSAPDMYIILVG